MLRNPNSAAGPALTCSRPPGPLSRAAVPAREAGAAAGNLEEAEPCWTRGPRPHQAQALALPIRSAAAGKCSGDSASERALGSRGACAMGALERCGVPQPAPGRSGSPAPPTGRAGRVW